MDDIDEGIGSNESTISNKETRSLIDSLKYLNGIQTDTNGEVDHLKIHHGSFTNGLPDGKDLCNDYKNLNNCITGEKSSGNRENHFSALNGYMKVNEKKCVTKDIADLVEDKDETVTTLVLANDDNCDKRLMTSIISNVDSIKVDQKVCAFTEALFHEETQHLIPENSLFNLKESEKSLHVLDDKIRNSLKGLVAKMKYIPDRKSNIKNITESNEIYDIDRPEMTASKKEITIEKLKKSDKQILHEERDNNDVKSSSDKTTAGLIQNGTDKSNCTSLEIKSNGTETSEKLMNRQVSTLSSDADNLENCDINDDDDEGIPMEIGSDNEDLLLQMLPENHKTSEYMSKPSIDEVQFNEVSQTSDSSGKINDIVQFLNEDLTNSPLAISRSGNANKPTPLDLNLKRSRSEDLPNIELDSKSDVKSSIELLGDAENDKVSTVFKVSNNCQEVSLAVSKISEETVNAKGKNEMIEKHANDNTQQEMFETKIPNTDTDDDIIFEGETKPESNSKLDVKIIQEDLSPKTNGINQIVCANTNCINDEHKKIETTVTNDLTTNEQIHVSASDDDVIFGKKVKANDILKQNCDISRINTNETKTFVKNQELPFSSENRYNPQSESSYKKVEHLGAAQKSNRKRPAEDKEINETLFKRSKLQGLIGQLEARVEPSNIEANDEPASIELSDSEGDHSATTDTAEERDSVYSEEDSLVKNQNVKPKTITLTELEMETLVREKVKAYLTSQPDTIIARLSQKIKELQTSNDLWKRQFSDLQVKVNDVTVLQKKLERRKAATAALRQINTRHVAVQVEEGKTTNTSKPKTAVVTPTESSPVVATVEPSGNTRTVCLPVPQSVLTSQIPQSSQMVLNTYLTPVRNLLDMTHSQRTVGSVPPVTASAKTSIISLLQCPTGYVTQTSNARGYLTMPGANVSNFVAKTVQIPSAANTITLRPPNSKVIDLTDDDENLKTCLVTLSSGLTMNTPGLHHVLAASPGTQLVCTSSNAQQTYQPVFNSTTPALQSTNTMVVASNSGKAETFLYTVSPPRVMKLTPAAGISSGITLAQAPSSVVTPKITLVPITHPAPFPSIPKDQSLDGFRAIPPKPSLKISCVSQGIVLSWNMVMTDNIAEICIYQLFAYQETSAPPSSALWKKVGDVKALPLPMACTLTQFQVGNKYHFAVRAMDVHKRVGQFSDPGSIHLTP